MYVTVPDDVRAWIRDVFRSCNARTTFAIARMPTTHEAVLDFALVSQAAEFSAPIRFPSDWIVRIDTHFLGGRRHFAEWEVADIGILLNFRRRGHFVKSKVLLLQSKRLYPREEKYDEDELSDYEIGFAQLFRGAESYDAISTPRMFAFRDDSRYEALKVGDDQYGAISDYEQRTGIPVYYMLYHPPVIPFSTVIPRLAIDVDSEQLSLGTRVLPSMLMRAALSEKAPGYKPSFGDVKCLSLELSTPTDMPPGWLLEEFIADLALDCKVGHVATKEADASLREVFYRRTGPIAAAVAVTFDIP
jgi:hypothetical protein